MKIIPSICGLASLAAAAFPASASAQTKYNGNGAGGFGGTVGGGVLTFSSNGTTLTGTITQGGSSGFNDELVIYIDAKAGGFTSTSTLTDTGGTGASGAPGDTLRAASSGFNGSARSTLNFGTGFGADFVLALSPAKAQFGALYTLDNPANFTYGTNGTNGNLNLTPTGANNSATYTFSLPLSLLGSPTSFTFATTYLDGNGSYRSNEAFGNTITDVTNPANTGNLGQDTGLVGTASFNVPEPSVWALVAVGAGVLCGVRLRRAGRI